MPETPRPSPATSPRLPKAALEPLPAEPKITLRVRVWERRALSPGQDGKQREAFVLITGFLFYGDTREEVRRREIAQRANDPLYRAAIAGQKWRGHELRARHRWL